jgi:hypothetical protein
VWFADPATRQERAFQVPDWARLETVQIAGDGKSVTLRFAAERPSTPDGDLWVEGFFWPDESRSGDQAALYVQIAGEPVDPALKGRVKAGEAVVWHKGGEVRVVRLAFAGPSVRLESEGWKPERAVLQRAYAFWLPREAQGWVDWMDRSPTVGSYARPSDVLMEAVRTFSGVAGTSLRRLPVRR